MISKLVLLLVAVPFLTFADDSAPDHATEKNGSNNAEIHLAKGYYLTQGMSTDGEKHADGSLYLSGHVVKPPIFGGWSPPSSPPPPPPQPQPVVSTNYQIWSPSFDIWNTAHYCFAIVAAVAAIWYTCSVVGTWGSWGHWGKSVSKKTTTVKETVEEDEEADGSVKKDDKAKSRRRRSVEADAELNRLTSIVLSAIESGECLQKTICLFGSQIGERKGRFASALLDKMVPPSLQSNIYFVTLKKSLKGELFCEKFKCNH